MSDNQLFSFERNRYYAGKMLTSSDFMAEQDYFNNKRKFLNHILFGSGIICGMSVFNLDDLSIMIESGAAIDGYGREIVIDKAAVRKLSAIEGFERLESDKVSLCVKYKEEPVHPVYALNKSTRDYECNRISEGYELFLADTNSIEPVYEMEQEFLTKLILAAGDSYAAELSMPITVCRGRGVNLILKIKKTDDSAAAFRLKCELQTPALLSGEGSHDLLIDTGNITLSAGEEKYYVYPLLVQDSANEDINIVVKQDTFQVYENDKTIEPVSNVQIKVSVSSILPEELITREVGKLSLEMQNLAGVRDYIRLADFQLERTGSTYLIASVEETGKAYLQTPSQAERRREYEKYFSETDVFSNPSLNRNSQINEEQDVWESVHNPMIATGTVEIPLGDRMKKGDIRYSGEIIHGLGKGNVYVKAGFEFMEEDKTMGKMCKSTIYGNPDLFKEKIPASKVETAVKVFNEKGSFVVAAKLLKETEFLILTLRWIAVKADSGDTMDRIEYYSGKSISPEKTTVVLGTKESFYFNVRFNNMEPCSVTYELTEPGSGEITLDGVYTAPAREGVYEIRIFCTDMPILCTYAYAVVRKKTEKSGGGNK